MTTKSHVLYWDIIAKASSFITLNCVAYNESYYFPNVKLEFPCVRINIIILYAFTVTVSSAL